MSTRNQRITATAWTYAAAGLAVSTNAAQGAVVDYHRAEDHNTGIHVLQDLHEYLASDRLVGKYLYLKFMPPQKNSWATFGTGSAPSA